MQMRRSSSIHPPTTPTTAGSSQGSGGTASQHQTPMSNRQLEAEAARDTLEKRTRFMDELTASTAQTYNDTLIRDPNMTRMDKVTREGLAKFFSENQHLRFPWAPVQPLEPLLGRLRHLLSNVTSREGHLGVMWTFLDEHEADLAPLFVLCSGTQVATAKLRA